MSDRFDVIYRGNDVSIDHHFCREWDGDRGCCGTNPHHGMSFDEARQEVAEFYQALANHWKTVTLEGWRREVFGAESVQTDDQGEKHE